MGSGLILLLVMNNMYHPTWGPAGFIGGLIPGLDFLPFWLGVVIAGIIQDIKKEKAAAGAISATVSTTTNAKASAAIKNFDGITKPANDNQPSYVQKAA